MIRKTTILLVILIISFCPVLFAEWVDVDGVGQESINVLSLSAVFPWMKIDSSDNPHIISVESNDVFYHKWNGATWVDADGVGQESSNISSIFSVGIQGAGFDLDSSGNPHIAWINSISPFRVYYLQWNGSAWVDADGAGTESVDFFTVDSVFWGQFVMNLDTLGNPHIIFVDNFSVMYYLKWNGSAWVDIDGVGQESVIIGNNFSGLSIAFELDMNDRAHICWHINDIIPAVAYLKWNGSAWVDADGVGQESIRIYDGEHSVFDVSMDLDSSNNPHIVWRNISNSMINSAYYLKWNGSTWVDTDGSGIESISVYAGCELPSNPHIQLDTFDNPHILWNDIIPPSTGRDLCYLTWNGSTWVDVDGSGTESVVVYDPLNNSDAYAHLRLDSGNNPNVAWNRSNNLGFIKWIDDPTPTITQTHTVSPTITPTNTETKTPTITITITPQPTLTITPTRTATPTLISTPAELALELKGGFPNPFKKSTNLIYELTAPASIEIKIYTVSGEIVFKQGDIPGTQGVNTFLWSGKNSNKRPVASGVYIFRITAIGQDGKKKEVFSKVACVR